LKSAYYISGGRESGDVGAVRVFVWWAADRDADCWRHHDDWGVLQLGYAFEQATNLGKRRPGVV